MIRASTPTAMLATRPLTQILLIAFTFALPISFVLTWLYRRAVKKAMGRASSSVETEPEILAQSLNEPRPSLPELAVAYAPPSVPPGSAAEDLRETGDPRGEVATLCSLGNAHIDVRDIPSAIQFYQQALLISHEIGDRSGECFSLANLGHAYYSLGENKLALEHHNQGLLISRELGDRRSEGLVRWNIAQVLRNDEDFAEATREGQRALAILDEIEDPKASIVRETLEAWRNTGALHSRH